MEALPRKLKARVQRFKNHFAVLKQINGAFNGQPAGCAAADADNAAHFPGSFYFGFYFIHHIHNFFRTAAQQHACFRQRKITPAHKKFGAKFLLQLLQLPA